MGKLIEDRNVIVLLSGGIDSSACISFFLDEKFNIEALFMEYGQLAARKELIAAQQISEYFNIKLRHVKLSEVDTKTKGLIMGRNALLVSLALMEFTFDNGIIALGIHSGTEYADCAPRFVKIMQSMLDLYTGGCIQLATPFLTWTKREIWDFCIKQRVPLHITYSCELGHEQPCRKCKSCLDLEALHACS